MQTSRLAVGVAPLAGLLLFGMVSAPSANADLGIELNGPYRVVSNGDWAKTNEVYMDEKPVVSVWTFSSSCTNAHTCHGTVSSDEGWTAPLEFRTTRWIVDRYHERWEPCPDGTFSPGRQRYQFQAVNANGQLDNHATTYSGYDRTIGVSGACGINTPLVIQIPMTVTKL